MKKEKDYQGWSPMSERDRKNLANELDKLQAAENKGKGVPLIQTIVSCLREDDESEAQATVYAEALEISKYPKIFKLLAKKGFQVDSEH